MKRITLHDLLGTAEDVPILEVSLDDLRNHQHWLAVEAYRQEHGPEAVEVVAQPPAEPEPPDADPGVVRTTGSGQDAERWLVGERALARSSHYYRQLLARAAALGIGRDHIIFE